jgi:hypothetical protein
VTAAVTPVSYPFEQVIAASKQLLYGVRPDGGSFLISYVILKNRFPFSQVICSTSSGLRPLISAIFSATRRT